MQASSQAPRPAHVLVSSEAADARTTMLGPDGGAFEPSCIRVTPWQEHYGSKLRLCGRVLDAQHNIPVQELLRLEAVIQGRERDREESR